MKVTHTTPHRPWSTGWSVNINSVYPTIVTQWATWSSGAPSPERAKEKQTNEGSLTKTTIIFSRKGRCRDMGAMWYFILIMSRLCKQCLTRSIWKDFSRGIFSSCPFNVIVSIGEKGNTRGWKACSGALQDGVRGVLSGPSLALWPWTLKLENSKDSMPRCHQRVSLLRSPPPLRQSYLSQIGSCP